MAFRSARVADRLDEQAFYANARANAFDMELGNVRGTNPIHGVWIGRVNVIDHHDGRRPGDEKRVLQNSRSG